jgi:hypothetical protein
MPSRAEVVREPLLQRAEPVDRLAQMLSHRGGDGGDGGVRVARGQRLDDVAAALQGPHDLAGPRQVQPTHAVQMH